MITDNYVTPRLLPRAPEQNALLFLQRDYGPSVELVQSSHCRRPTTPRGLSLVVLANEGVCIAADAGDVCIGTTHAVSHARTTGTDSNAIRASAVWLDRRAAACINYNRTSTGSNYLSDHTVHTCAVRDYTGSPRHAVLAVGRWAAAAV
jgi:hypothetical protein